MRRPQSNVKHHQQRLHRNIIEHIHIHHHTRLHPRICHLIAERPLDIRGSLGMSGGRAASLRRCPAEDGPEGSRLFATIRGRPERCVWGAYVRRRGDGGRSRHYGTSFRRTSKPEPKRRRRKGIETSLFRPFGRRSVQMREAPGGCIPDTPTHQTPITPITTTPYSKSSRADFSPSQASEDLISHYLEKRSASASYRVATSSAQSSLRREKAS